MWRVRQWRFARRPTVRCRRLPVLALGAVGAVPPSLGVVEGGEIPYKPEALATRKQNQQDWLNLDPEIKCYLPGVPRATYMPYPFQILQSASALTFVYEYAGAVRNIFLKDPGPAPADSWMGQSVGHWEGDTLVIDVTDLNDQTWFDRAGNFHSDKLHVVERYTRTSPDVISYEATIEDPNVFTRPWKISMPLYRRQEKNAQLLDFKCVEFVEELLYGPYRKHPLEQVIEEVWDMRNRFIFGMSAVGMALAIAVSYHAPRGGSGDENRVNVRPAAHAGRTSGLAGHLRPGHDDAARAAGLVIRRY